MFPVKTDTTEMFSFADYGRTPQKLKESLKTAAKLYLNSQPSLEIISVHKTEGIFEKSLVPAVIL